MNKKKQLLAGCRKVTLADVCEVTRGKPITAKSVTRGDIPVIAGGRTPAYYHNEANRPANTITVSGSGAYAGFVNYFDAPIFASDCSTVRSLNESDVATKFVYYFLVANQQLIYDKKRGAAQPHIYPSDLVDMRLPLPPPEKQKEILALLNRQMTAVEKARLAAEEKTAAARLLPSALLREVFAYSENDKLPDGWRLSPMGEVADMIFGQSPPSAYYSRIPNGMPFFQGKADFGKDKPVPRVWCTKPIRIASPGDILLSIRAPVGPTIVTDIECCIGRGLCALRPKKKILHRDFLLLYLRAAESQLAAMGQGSTFHSIGKNALVAFHIPLPPVKEQRHIASLLNRQMASVETARLAAEEELRAINALPAALLREVFGVE